MAEEDDLESGEGGGSSGLRPFWSGTITFGLVNVPVNLFAATRTARVSLHMVTGEGTQLQRRYYCAEDGEELDWDDIVRGYEIEKGKYVVVTDDELEAIEPRKSRDIDLRVFVGRDEIDPMLFERAYYLTPAAGSNKAYRLLAEVMEQTGRAGIATFVMRTKEYLIAILADDGILRAETLRFSDEIRTPEAVGLPKKKKASPVEVKKFEKAIASRVKELDLEEFLDPTESEFEKVARAKQKKHEGVVKRTDETRREERGGGEVIDILDVLRRSLQGKAIPAEKAAAGAKKPVSKKSAARKPATKEAAPKRKPAKSAAKETAAKKAAPAKKTARR